MPLYNTEAVNIRSRNTGEADKIITLFTRNYGKIQAIAKGARRPSSKFGGRLEIFAYNQMLLASARTFDIISQCETIESFYTLREDRDKINAGVYFIKLIDMATEDRQRNEGLFDLLLCSLRLLAGQADPVVLSRAFEVKFCDTEGLLPSNEMLEKRYRKLPALVSALGRVFVEGKAEISEKDLEISGKIFKELISDQIGKDIRRYKPVL